MRTVSACCSLPPLLYRVEGPFENPASPQRLFGHPEKPRVNRRNRRSLHYATPDFLSKLDGVGNLHAAFFTAPQKCGCRLISTPRLCRRCDGCPAPLGSVPS